MLYSAMALHAVKSQWSRRLRDVKQQSIPRHNQLVLSTLIIAYIEIK